MGRRRAAHARRREAADDAGIRFVHQDLGLVGTLNAIDNLAITAGLRRPGSAAGSAGARRPPRTREALATLGLADLDIKAPVHSLPPSQRTAIAIARALVGWEDGASLLILDEPTATLPGADVRRLFDVIHRLRERASRSSTSPITSTRCSSSPTASPSCATACARRRPCPSASSTTTGSSS